MSQITIYQVHICQYIVPSQNSGIEKAFLFDVVSKIYIATDSSPVDMQSYELCCDMIDVVIDVSCIYGWEAGMQCSINSLPFKSLGLGRVF